MGVCGSVYWEDGDVMGSREHQFSLVTLCSKSLKNCGERLGIAANEGLELKREVGATVLVVRNL